MDELPVQGLFAGGQTINRELDGRAKDSDCNGVAEMQAFGAPHEEVGECRQAGQNAVLASADVEGLGVARWRPLLDEQLRILCLWPRVLMVGALRWVKVVI